MHTMSIDIVNLIESNTITQFTGDYQHKFIERVKNSFSNYEQQLFLCSFYCYLKYDPFTDFVIDLDNIWKWVGFAQKVKAKILLENHFQLNRDYKKLSYTEAKNSNLMKDDGMPQLSQRVNQTHQKGGHNKEFYLLNINTFKKFCLKAGTSKSAEVHEYFVKLETIMFDITREECDELKKKLLELKEDNEELKNKLITQKELIHGEFLLKKYADCSDIDSIVYIIKVKTFDDGTYIIKIGESRRGITSRYNECKSKHKNIVLLDCFQVNRSKDFELFLHTHSKIHPNKVTNLEGHESERELFLVGKELSYQMILKIIDDNIHNYSIKPSELLLENKYLKLKNAVQNSSERIDTQMSENNNTNSILQQFALSNKIIMEKLCSLENTVNQLQNKSNTQESRLVTGFHLPNPHLGPRLQKINCETMQLIHVYESVSEAMKEDNNIKRPSLMKSIKENTVYCGYCWRLVERNLDANIIYSDKPARKPNAQNLGYIAKLNAEKTEILNVYLDRKTAANMNGDQSISALDIPVKKRTLTNGHYYVLYDQCENEVVEPFEEKYGRPLLYKNGIGQYDLTGQLVQEFECKYECIKKLKLSDKTLSKALVKNIPYQSHFYRELGPKLSLL